MYKNIAYMIDKIATLLIVKIQLFKAIHITIFSFGSSRCNVDHDKGYNIKGTQINFLIKVHFLSYVTQQLVQKVIRKASCYIFKVSQSTFMNMVGFFFFYTNTSYLIIYNKHYSI